MRHLNNVADYLEDAMRDERPRDSVLNKKSSFIFHNPIVAPTQTAAPKVVLPAVVEEIKPCPKFIRVKSDMENFKAKSVKRLRSCPLLVSDVTSDRFKIYDKEFCPSPSVKTAAHTPGDN